MQKSFYKKNATTKKERPKKEIITTKKELKEHTLSVLVKL